MWAQSYIESRLRDEPTWHTCVDLDAIMPSHELGRVMGGIASALRSGSDITHEDWGEDWIEFSLKHLQDMEPLKELSNARRYPELDAWLEQNEDRIVRMIHAAYSRQIKNQNRTKRCRRTARSRGGCERWNTLTRLRAAADSLGVATPIL